jgi:hypothetical protein
VEEIHIPNDVTPIENAPPIQAGAFEQVYTMTEECSHLGIPPHLCTENAILAKKRLEAYQNPATEGIHVLNAHLWVGTNATGIPNPDSVAGFVVQNTGDKVVSIQSITVRGQSVPVNQWWYNNTESVATLENTHKELGWESNFNMHDGYDMRPGASQETLTKASGPISLNPGQSAFIFLDSPAGINSIDTGLAFTVNIAAGKASAVQSVAVVSVGVSS